LPRTIEALRQRSNDTDDVHALIFIEAAEELLGLIAPLIQRFASDVERTYRLNGFEQEVMCSRQDWTLRYLHYWGGTMLARQHADRLGLTCHLYESDPGGEYLDFDFKWRPWPVSDRQTIIFPSMGLQYRSGGSLKALWHRVVPTPYTRVNGRYSMVAFIDFKADREFTRAKRVQDFPLGFNYGCSWEAFASHFVPCKTQAA
jgi:isopenicillin N synthase-like dioxygenase